MNRNGSVPTYAHVAAMTDRIGMFEHADHAVVRREHGYCTDDVARLLIVSVREPAPDREVRALARTAFRFLTQSQSTTGRTRNRRAANGRWHGRHGVDDCWGRSLWAFGTAARLAPEEWMRSVAMSSFNHGVANRSPHRRAMAFAALGAAEVAEHDRRHLRSRLMLADAIEVIDGGGGGSSAVGGDDAWPWPEPRLAYANAAIPEALIAAGHVLDRPEVIERGLTLLGWLLERETLDGHLSPTPTGGAGPGDAPPRFDQQPIEVAAMADACARARAVTGDDIWQRGVDLAIGWFEGDNDLGAVMWDLVTNGGYDGLTPTGPNLNQGAESTLALISTMQHAARLAGTSIGRPPITGPSWPAG